MAVYRCPNGHMENVFVPNVPIACRHMEKTMVSRPSTQVIEYRDVAVLLFPKFADGHRIANSASLITTTASSMIP